MARTRSALALALLAAWAPAATRPAGGIRDPESLIVAMHERYEGLWFQTLVYDQRTAASNPGPGHRGSYRYPTGRSTRYGRATAF